MWGYQVYLIMAADTFQARHSIAKGQYRDSMREQERDKTGNAIAICVKSARQ